MSFRSAILYSFGTRYVAMGFQLLATIILARLLSPSEIGIYSVGSAVIMIAHTLRDFGTSTYVVQEPELTQARLRTAFTLTMMVAWALAAILWLASGPLARFYRESGVGTVLEVLAINFALIPFGSITIALIRRDMNFRAIMFITVASTMVHSGSSVLFAALGYGFISLAWGSVCGSLTTVIGALLARGEAFFLKPSLSEHKRVLAFGMRSSISSIAAEAGHSAPDMVLGRMVGMEGTGLFSRAMGYVQLFERLLQDVIRSVMLPYLAQEVRAEGDVRAKINHALENIVSISWFIIALTAVLAEPMIAMLYGAQWESAVPIAQILCIAMAVRCVAPTLASALVAKGHIKLVMQTALFSTAAKVICLVAASPFGLSYAALGFTIAETTGVLVLIHFTTHTKLFSWADCARIGFRALPMVTVGILPSAVFIACRPVTDSYLLQVAWLVSAGLISTFVWIIMIWAWNRPPKHELARLLVFMRTRV